MRQFEITIRATDGAVLRRFATFASSKGGASRKATEAGHELPAGTSWTVEVDEI
ncbi:hypothetical protein [Falsiroseomonas sp. CW058]|uniref:hypothetical protein n=1 Tax=Falsiroseomonas sp. CW058 TaxID=3388664 RepID=UPI003D3236B5